MKWNELSNEEKKEFAFNYLKDNYSEEVVDFATCIYGYSNQTLENVLYYYEGTEDFEEIYNDHDDCY